MTVHKDISVDKEKVVSQFSQSPRRIRLFENKSEGSLGIVNTFMGFHIRIITFII